jgi:hypothetical protein
MSNRSVLRVVPGDNGVDLAVAEAAAAQFLTALGVALGSESTAARPAGWHGRTRSCSHRVRSS